MRETTNPKLQIPKKSQFPVTKPMRAGSIRFEIWVLVLVWGLGFGLWSL